MLQTLVALLRGKRGPKAVAVVAPTGIAALGVGGVTVHRFIGAGLCQGTADEVLATVMRSDKAVRRWRETEVLVIDEVWEGATTVMSASLPACTKDLWRLSRFKQS